MLNSLNSDLLQHICLIQNLCLRQRRLYFLRRRNIKNSNSLYLTLIVTESGCRPIPLLFRQRKRERNGLWQRHDGNVNTAPENGNIRNGGNQASVGEGAVAVWAASAGTKRAVLLLKWKYGTHRRHWCCLIFYGSIPWIFVNVNKSTLLGCKLIIQK